jgi:hypothetical protein
MVIKNFWDWLAYVALASVVVWLILKGLGVFNTPFLLEYYPYFVVTYYLGWQTHKLSEIGKEVGGLKKFQNQTINQINDLKINCTRNHK